MFRILVVALNIIKMTFYDTPPENKIRFLNVTQSHNDILLLLVFINI